VFAGSIRDDGPLPEVVTDVVAAQKPQCDPRKAKAGSEDPALGDNTYNAPTPITGRVGGGRTSLLRSPGR
jgi:hypothetical protein